MEFLDKLKKYDKILQSSFVIMLLVVIVVGAVGYYSDKPHVEDTQNILNNTKTLQMDSEKINHMYRDNLNNISDFIINMKFIDKLKKYDKILQSSFVIMLLVVIVVGAVGYYSDKPHVEDTQNILNNTKTLPKDSEKIDLIYRRDLNEMLESEGSSLEEVRIINEDSNRISDMYFDDGIKDITNENYQSSYQNFVKSLTLNKNSSVSYLNAASSALKFKGFDGIDEALGYMDIAYNIAPESSSINYNYGYILFKKSVYDVDALNYLQNATKLNPEDKMAWKYLALSSYYTENYTLSKDATEKALEMMPNDELMWEIRGGASQQIDDLDQQLKTYDLVIANCTQCPNIDQYWFNKAVIYAQKGEYEKMIDSFNNSIKVNPLMRKEILEIYIDLIGATEVKEIANINSTNEVIVIKDEKEIIPSLVYNETIFNNKIESVNVVFFVNDKQAKYELAFADSVQPIPQYRTENSKEMEYEGKPMNLLWYYIDQMKNLN